MLFVVVAAPFVLAIILAFFGKYLGNKIGWFALPMPVLVFGYFFTQIANVRAGSGPSFFYQWLPSFGINLSFSVNGLGLLFALLISGVGMIVFWYSIGYLSHKERLNNFYCFILIFMGAMIGVVTSANLMMMYLFWELTSFSSFLLIGFWYEQERPRYGAQKSLFITVIGGFAMFAAFVLMGNIAGSFELPAVLAAAPAIKASPLYVWIVLLILLGAFTKSAQIPFHIWLPDAMEAPTPISCYLHSATMVKAGIYLLAVMTQILGDTALWFGIVSGVGIGSLIWGSYRAMKMNDLKAILANSTISQLGLIIALVGYGSQAAFAAALFHLLNHSAFKGSLFLVTGMVDHATGTRDIRRLSGLAKVMPVTAVFAAMGAAAMAGLPPFNGFLSKEMFLESSLEVVNGNLAFLGGAAWLFPAIAVIGSVFTFVYCCVILFRVFIVGDVPHDLPHHPHEPEKMMLVPTGILVSLTLVIAVFPNWFAENLLAPAILAVSGEAAHLHIAFWHGFNLPLICTLIIIGAGTLIYLNFDKWKAAISRMPKLISSNDIYDWLIPKNHLAHGGERLINTHMTGRLRDYMAFSSLAFVLVVLGVMLLRGALVISFDDLAPISPFEILWAVVIIVSAIAICRFDRRIPAIFALGMIGYSVSFFFVIFRAPDLALTQLLVETVSLVLFFLAFRYLPKLFKDKPAPRAHNIVNLVISVAVGLTVTLIVMVGHSNKMYQTIADYYIQNAKILGGGNNIVNVILVDFRGLDTAGEISVIALAAIGVYVLISLIVKPEPRLLEGGEEQHD
ncbi:MAG: proton-conducting transporter membrane subunit [Bacillota bacterium]|nr:proton-conducting transporter membrane subunit [Bacillota bacterium]